MALNNVPSVLNSSVSKFSRCKNSKSDLIANVASEILANNSKRMYAVFINKSQGDITLVFDDRLKAVIDEGIVIKGNGGSYEITLNNLYAGKVSAISAINSQLSFVECSE